MSSGEEDVNDLEHGGHDSQESKKRRIQRACDTCRRKKIRCDGGQMRGNRCSNCSSYNLECTYVEAAKKRGPPKGYVESLENRLENMEKLLQRLCPDADFTQELGASIDRDSWAADRQRSLDIMPSRSSRPTSPVRGLTQSLKPPIPVDPDDLQPSDDELAHSTLAEGLKRLAVEPLDARFHGKSSGIMLVQAAMNLKQEFDGSSKNFDLLPPTRRPEFWAPHPWEIVSDEQVVHYHYPPDELIPELVDAYFNYVNAFFPILHRPSFDRALNDHRHHTDIGFGSVVMIVCAIGSRWNEDSRCLLKGMTKHSSGWKWFDQVQVHRKSFMSPPRLYDLQIYALSSIFLHSSSSPQASWTMIGIGIRLAQDVGAHRRKVYNAPVSVESELWKRAFWVLVSLDRFGSASLGRPCAIQDEDFDLDLPLEVDDEYWEHPDPSKAFKQPAGIPCSISFFNSFLKLNQILAFALRTIYSINKSKILLGFIGPQWEQHIVAELDSALNKWIDTVPDHLRWDPHRENSLHFNQSATLYATYYHLQILIHRPFIPSPRKPSPLTFPSLAICTNAARSCSHVSDVARRRGCLPLPQMQVAAFTSGIVLLLNIWGAKKSGTFIDTGNQMADVHKCMEVIRGMEDRFISAGRLWDILNELACAGDISVNKMGAQSNKRERGSDSPMSSAGTPPAMPPAQILDGGRLIAGRRALGNFSPSMPSTAGTTAAANAGGLPYGTEQLAATDPGLGIQWMSPAGGAGAAPMYGNAPLQPGQGAMPNLNIFDLFEPEDAAQLYSNGLPMAGYGVPIPGVTHQKGAGYGVGGRSQHAPPPDTYGSTIEGAPGMAQVPEALQMWSSAPTSFDMEDWGSYLHNVNQQSPTGTH